MNAEKTEVAETMNPKKVATEWYERGKQESDPFYKFICYWISFNALYGSSKGVSERKQIENYVEKILKGKKIEIKQNDTLTFFYTPIKDLRKPRKMDSDTSDCVKILKDENCKSWERLLNLLLCVYQARCNLFHGDKLPVDYRDQEVAKNSAKVLEEYLPYFLQQ